MASRRYNRQELDEEAYAAADCEARIEGTKIWNKNPIWRLEVAPPCMTQLLVIWWDAEQKAHETTVIL